MKVSIIVAASLNNAIGKDNQLLWHLPNDLKFFKQTTWAMPVVIGRKTFESLGGKMLNGRVNIIITRQKDYTIDNAAVIVNSLDDALFVAQQHQYREVYIAGGGEVYKDAMKIAHTIYLTRVNTVIDGDTFFEIDTTKWQLISTQPFDANEKHAYSYQFETWIRK